MNNGLKMVLIGLLSIISIGLVILLFILINNNFQFNSNLFSRQSNTLIASKEFENVKDIYINSNTADVYIKDSEDGKIRAELYSDSAKKYDIALSNGDLKVELEEKNNFVLFGKQARIILYVPSSYANKVDITATTGDIEASAYEKATFKVNVTSGDVNIDEADSLDITTKTGDIKNNKVNTIKVTCITGDIKLGSINKSLDLKTTTGDITIDTINLLENSSIQTTTGDVIISHKNNIYIETESKTGDVNINNNDRFAELTLHIKVTTGDIMVD